MVLRQYEAIPGEGSVPGTAPRSDAVSADATMDDLGRGSDDAEICSESATRLKAKRGQGGSHQLRGRTHAGLALFALGRVLLGRPGTVLLRRIHASANKDQQFRGG